MEKEYGYSLNLQNKEKEELFTFFMRKPRVLDLEVFLKELKTNTTSAYLNLFSRLLLKMEIDEKNKLITTLREEYPLAVYNFIEEEIRPFFGKVIKVMRL